MKKLPLLFKDKLFLLLFFVLVVIFFYPFLFYGKIPIPSDAILGLYHPYRDVVWDGFISGVPFKNFLITDPIRQQYIWRNLAIEGLKQKKLPLWNPYSFTGTPLLANFQSAAFYPLNVIFFVLPFEIAWGVLIISQPLLGGFFFFLYIRNLGVKSLPAFISTIALSFSGFSIAWLEWNTVGHVMMWLPLVLLSSDKIISYLREDRKKLSKLVYWWEIVLFTAFLTSFLAGHLQVYVYILLLFICNVLFRTQHFSSKKVRVIAYCFFPFICALVLSLVQIIPTAQFIRLSARSYDQSNVMKEGWFLPFQHLLQFIAPDFFGNPATLNYWGVWNYGEFVGYIGILPLLFALYVLFVRKERYVLFYFFITLTALAFALPTPLAKIPFILHIPLLSTSQPTRLLSLVVFSLSILSGFGLDHYLYGKNENRKLPFYIISGTLSLFLLSLLIVLFTHILPIDARNEEVAKRNLIFPIFFVFLVIGISIFLRIRNKLVTYIAVGFMILLIIVDMFKFGWKFTPFTKREWLFPKTEILRYLTSRVKPFRVMSDDRRIMPPNFFAYYHIEDVSGYDPLYLLKYNQLAATWDRAESDITPATFNRIVTPHKIESFLTDFLGVRYILSFNELSRQGLIQISSEGETKLFENEKAFPRAFFVEKVITVTNERDQIKEMFRLREQLRTIALTSKKVWVSSKPLKDDEKITFEMYDDNFLRLRTTSNEDRLLILTDPNYPGWNAYIDGLGTEIITVNFMFRGILVPKGTHTIEMKMGFL